MTHELGIVCAFVAALGGAYALVAVRAVRSFGAHYPERAILVAPLGITLLRPLHGDEPLLYDNLASFCDQDYAGPVQIVFGVQDSTDAAVPIVHRLIAARPDQAIELVVSPSSHGVNAKVANLAGMQARIRHEIVLIADSDIGVGHTYLSSTIAALHESGVGLVTCLYRGAEQGGLWSRLAAMAIDYHFLPSVLVGVQIGMARPCFGSTIALRRETLAAVGGFDAFLDHLADDHALGEAVRALGLRVALAPAIVSHACPERHFSELLTHELRWARTIRALNPLGYAGSIITHTVPFALIAAALSGLGALGVGTLAIALACRLLLQVQVDGTLHIKKNRWWLGPIRDLLSFTIYIASFFVSAVDWRGRRYQVGADGTLSATPIEDART